MRATILTSDIAAAGTVNVTVFTPAPGGGTSASQTLTINNLAPVLTSINPSMVNAGGADFVIQANGSNFNNSSIIRFNGSNRLTTFVISGQITATITAADIANGGTSIENPPGIREGTRKLYLAYLRDPFGNKLCSGCPIP